MAKYNQRRPHEGLDHNTVEKVKLPVFTIENPLKEAVWKKEISCFQSGSLPEKKFVMLKKYYNFLLSIDLLFCKLKTAI